MAAEVDFLKNYLSNLICDLGVLDFGERFKNKCYCVDMIHHSAKEYGQETIHQPKTSFTPNQLHPEIHQGLIHRISMVSCHFL